MVFLAGKRETGFRTRHQFHPGGRHAAAIDPQLQFLPVPALARIVVEYGPQGLDQRQGDVRLAAIGRKAAPFGSGRDQIVLAEIFHRVAPEQEAHERRPQGEKVVAHGALAAPPGRCQGPFDGLQRGGLVEAGRGAHALAEDHVRPFLVHEKQVVGPDGSVGHSVPRQFVHRPGQGVEDQA